jgi:hypothetical protein
MLLQHSGSTIQGTKHPSVLPPSSAGEAEIRSPNSTAITRDSPDRIQAGVPGRRSG